LLDFGDVSGTPNCHCSIAYRLADIPVIRFMSPPAETKPDEAPYSNKVEEKLS
jgi:hypothetical protein